MRAGSCRPAKVIGCARQSDMLAMQEQKLVTSQGDKRGGEYMNEAKILKYRDLTQREDKPEWCKINKDTITYCLDYYNKNSGCLRICNYAKENESRGMKNEKS